eukprot:890152-Rhodomonas_salina.1
MVDAGVDVTGFVVHDGRGAQWATQHWQSDSGGTRSPEAREPGCGSDSLSSEAEEASEGSLTSVTSSEWEQDSRLRLTVTQPSPAVLEIANCTRNLYHSIDRA